MQCRQLTEAQARGAAGVLAEAFLGDPLCALMLPFKRSRLRTLATFYRPYCALAARCGRLYGAGEPLQGAAIWIPPGQDGMSISVKAAAAFVPLLASWYPIGWLRARPVLRAQAELHSRHAGADHYYLDNIGVAASARGQGLASLLVRPFLETADQAGVAAYTDTFLEANVALYENFDFRCVERRTVGDTGVSIWALRRP